MTPFEHQLIRKYIVVFGTFFNDIIIQRGDDVTPDTQKFKVPIEFGPREKYLAMTNAKPTDEKKRAIQLPRMSYEMTGMSFDATRKIERRMNLNDGERTTLRGAPWNINFRLSIMSKNMFDATKIVEQVLFMFQPDYVVDVKLLKGFDHMDRISTDYVSIGHQDEYEGEFERVRRTIWEIDFVMKAWLYGPIGEGKQIKKIDVSLHPSLNVDSDYEQITITPGLTVDGEPTTDPNETIPYQEINEDDNYGIITELSGPHEGPFNT